MTEGAIRRLVAPHLIGQNKNPAFAGFLIATADLRY